MIATSKEARLAVVEAGLRWANNIIVELAGNHSGILSATVRNELKTATDALQYAIDSLRRAP